MKKVICFMIMASLSVLVACGSSTTPAPTPDPTSDVTVTLAPIDGATDQAVDATVTAIFSAAITAPADWTTAFTLIAAGATETLCTEVAYDADTLTATCTHADLVVSTEHTITVSGVTDADSLAIATATAIFTTTSASDSYTATFTSKDSVTSTSEGDTVTLTFTFDSAPDSTPTIAVAEASANLSASESVEDDLSLAIAAGTCTVSESDATICTCTVTGVAGCTTLTDYTATISVDGVEAGTVTFNSSDDEFTSSDTLGANEETETCWTQDNDPERGTASIGDSNFTVNYIDYDYTGDKRLMASKSLSSVGDYSVLFYISNNVVTTSGGDDSQLSINRCAFGTGPSVDKSVAVKFGYFGAISSEYYWYVWADLVGNYNPLNIAYPNDTSETLDTNKAKYEEVYACSVRKSDSFKHYLSFDGSTFTELTTTNLTNWPGLSGTIENAANPTLAGTDMILRIGSDNEISNDNTTSFGYVRIKTTGITGLSATDCPVITAN